MADSAYFRWVAAGKPYNVAYPARDLKATLKGHGYVVYDYPNEAHQKADPAQDHTAYSETGWPIESPEWWGHALDVMPPPAGARSKINGLPLPPIHVLSAQILKDRKAGHDGIDWLKYMNRPATSAIYSQPFYQERWTPTYDRRTSTDYGHIHLSARSDWTKRSTTATRAYDPVARAQGVMDVTVVTGFDATAKAQIQTEVEQGVVASMQAQVDKPFDWHGGEEGASPDARITARGWPSNGTINMVLSYFFDRFTAEGGEERSANTHLKEYMIGPNGYPDPANPDGPRLPSLLMLLTELVERPAAPPPVIDAAMMAAAVRGALTDPEVIAPLAAAVADTLWVRLAPPTPPAPLEA